MEKNQFLFLTSLFRTRWGGGKGPLKFEIDCSHSMVKCRNWCRKKGRLCEIPIEGASQNIQPHNRTWLKCTDSSKVSKRNTNHILCKRKKISNKPEQAYEQPSNMAGFIKGIVFVMDIRWTIWPPAPTKNVTINSTKIIVVYQKESYGVDSQIKRANDWATEQATEQATERLLWGTLTLLASNLKQCQFFSRISKHSSSQK